MGFLYEKIYEDANCLEIASSLGIPMKRRGNTIYIACPEHFENTGKKDLKIDKCTCNEKGYHCFSCEAKGGATKLVAKTLGLSMHDATSKVISMLPNPENYKGDMELNYKPFPLNSEQLAALGLVRRAMINMPKNVAWDKQEAKNSGMAMLNGDSGFSEDGFEGYIVGHTGSYSLDQLFNTDFDAFQFLIYGKAWEMEKQYDKILRMKLINIAFSKVLSAEDIYHMENVIKRYKRICNRLMKKYRVA